MKFANRVKVGASNIARHWLFRRFNTMFFNKEYYDSNPPNVFNAALEDNVAYEDKYFMDVVEFCIDNEVPKFLGLSPSDIMRDYDLPTYYKLKEYVINRNQERYKHLNDVQTKIEKRQEEMLNKGK